MATVVSMFSGCGGFDVGFQGNFDFNGRHYDSLPFDVIWANDINAAACASYRRNVSDIIRQGDARELLPLMPDSADVVIGGFPCQDISINGNRKGVDGPRSRLYRVMVAAVDKIRPKVFVAENVKGLLMPYNADSLKQVLGDFGGLGYAVSYRLYNTADYGVPQTRQRVIIVGTLPGFQFTPPLAPLNQSQWATARDVIADFEATPADPSRAHIWSAALSTKGQGGRRLKADLPAPTVRAECHGNNPFHYSLPRRVSMRETARFQSFPDDYQFLEKIRETERMIGNAVPPVFAWHIACAVAQTLQM